MGQRKKLPMAQPLLLTIPDVAIQSGCVVLLCTISSIVRVYRQFCLEVYGVCILTRYVSG